MPLNDQDSKWTAYLLGELDAEGRADVERELAESPEARQLVDELRRTIDLLSAELAAESCPALSDSQRATALAASATAQSTEVVQPSAKMARGPLIRRPMRWALAATLLIAAGSAALLLPTFRAARESGSRVKVASNDHYGQLAPQADNNRSSARTQRHVTDAPMSSPVERKKHEVIDDSRSNLQKGLSPGKVAEERLAGRSPAEPVNSTVARPLTRLGVGVSPPISGPASEAPPTPFNAPVGGVQDSPPLQSGLEVAHGKVYSRGDKKLLADHDAENALLAEREAPLSAHAAEAYDDVHDNPFLKVADSPLSTFSIDVDTASYAIVRRFLRQNGQLPPRSAVRIEELVNYFRYDYPQPEGEHPFAANVEVADCPWNGGHRLVRIGLKGREIARDSRPLSNLVFLVDVSGSMLEPNKLPLVKQSLRLLTEQLGENDRVAVVVYAGNSGLALPSTNGSEKTKILQSIDALEGGGSTNGAQGIQLAYDTATAHFIPGGTNRVILATDGDFNVGVTDRGELVKLIEQKAKSGVFLTALGFGMGNLKDATLEQLADKGNGNYAYIDDLKEAKKVLVEELTGTLVTIAKDVKIQIEFNPTQVAAFRLIGYENRILAHQDFNDDKKDAGEIGAGHTVTALYELVPAVKNDAAAAGEDLPAVDALKYQQKTELTPAANNGELLTLKLRYKQPDGEKSRLVEFPVKDSGLRYGQATRDFKFAASVALFGMLLRDSPYKGTATFAAAAELAQEGRGSDLEGYRAEFIELIQAAQSLSSQK